MNDIVLTCYLTGKDDPQRRLRWKPEDDAVVNTWITSLRKAGLQGIIYHDGLAKGFCDRWSSADVEFIRVQWTTPWTAAEERVAIYYRELTSRLQECNRVLTTDVSDVEFYRNPFALMTDPEQIMVGSEREYLGGTILRLWSRQAYHEVLYADRKVLNCGILGGHRPAMLRLLHLWLREMYKAGVPKPPHDIVAFNRVMFRERIPTLTGAPVHTVFRWYEGPESGCCMRHK